MSSREPGWDKGLEPFEKGAIAFVVVVCLVFSALVAFHDNRTEAPPDIVYRVTQWTPDGNARTWHSHHVDFGEPTIEHRNAEHPNLRVWLYPNMRIEEVVNVK